MIWGRAVTLVNGRIVPVPGRETASSIRFASRVLGLGERPRRGDTVVDLDGRFVLPGLLNAHDHLELNHYGRIKFRERYLNASEWIDDMRPRLADDRSIRAASRHPLTERLFIGGLKNILAGVTTVAHHNPYYRELRGTMPVRVVRRYGWAHSFALQDEPAGARGERGGDVEKRWRRTAANAPFFVHLAEGVDAAARAELDRLASLGCLAANTVAVHGVAIDGAGSRRLAAAGASLVWCPSSNLFLFGRTASVRLLVETGSVALGSDSRLTGENDLLEELRAALATGCASEAELLAMVTVRAAEILRLRQAGRLEIGAPADFVVLPAGRTDAAAALLAATRRDVALVAVGGRPLVGDPPLGAVFRARGVTARPITVDDSSKIADSAMARRIAGCPIAEPGVTA